MSSGRLCIGVVVSRFPVRSETFILQQIQGLLDRGIDVKVLPVKHLTSEPIPDDYRHINRLVLPPIDPEVARARRGASLLRAAAMGSFQRPQRTARLLSRHSEGRQAIASTIDLADRLRRNRPIDLLHCHYGPIGVVAQRARGLLRRHVPLTVAFHGYDLSRTSVIDSKGYRSLFAEAELLLPVSDTWRRELIDRGAPPQRTVTHHMGIDLTRLRLITRTHRSPFELLSVCRLVEKKGISDAIAAVAILLSRGYEVHYRIIGDGPLMPDLEHQIRELGVEDSVGLEGWQPPEVVSERLRTAQTLLAPSVTARDGDQEGIPLSIMEAMGTGLPVISTWHSGIPELIIDGACGLLVPEHQPRELADRVALLIDDPGLRERLGRQGHERVRQRHDQHRLDDDLATRFRQLVDQNARASR